MLQCYVIEKKIGGSGKGAANTRIDQRWRRLLVLEWGSRDYWLEILWRHWPQKLINLLAIFGQGLLQTSMWGRQSVWRNSCRPGYLPPSILLQQNPCWTQAIAGKSRQDLQTDCLLRPLDLTWRLHSSGSLGSLITPSIQVLWGSFEGLYESFTVHLCVWFSWSSCDCFTLKFYFVRSSGRSVPKPRTKIVVHSCPVRLPSPLLPGLR